MAHSMSTNANIDKKKKEAAAIAIQKHMKTEREKKVEKKQKVLQIILRSNLQKKKLKNVGKNKRSSIGEITHLLNHV